MRNGLLITATAAALLASSAGAQGQQLPPGADDAQLPGQNEAAFVNPFDPVNVEKLDERQRKLLEALPGNLATPDTTFEDLVADWMTAKPFPKETVIKIDDTYAYPHVAFNYKMEIVKEEGDTIWLRGLPPEDPDSFLHKLWQRVESMELQTERIREQLAEAYFLDFNLPLSAPVSVDTLTFEPAGRGLPDRGRWQMAFDMADMNGDGRDDLVLAPSRKGRPQPTILLGREAATFEPWSTIRWPGDVPFDYGAVAAADFDRDGHLDLALAIHFKPQYVLYGDGRGGFTRSAKLPSPDPRLSSRAVATGDINSDGLPDLVFLAEVDYDLTTNQKLPVPTLWVLLNNGAGGWKVDTEGLPPNLIGDNIAVVDIDGDGRDDILPASNRGGWRALAFLNTEDGWKSCDGSQVLSNAYHFDLAPIRGADGTILGIASVFEQFRTHKAENQARTGLIIYPWKDEGVTIRNQPVVFDDQRTNPYFRVAVGDVNGDGLDDLVTSRKGGGLEVFVQAEDGRFLQERSPEIGPTARAYDLQIVDFDGDGRGDIAAMFADLDEMPGGLRIWLSRDGS